jgi:NADH dehydrogenase FAD-containing subunit
MPCTIGAGMKKRIAAPLRGVLSRQKNTRVLLGEVVDVDPSSRRVVLADGAAFPYDALIALTAFATPDLFPFPTVAASFSSLAVSTIVSTRI